MPSGRASGRPRRRMGQQHLQKNYVFMMRQIANDLSLNGPPSKFDIARYVYGEPLLIRAGCEVAILEHRLHHAGGSWNGSPIRHAKPIFAARSCSPTASPACAWLARCEVSVSRTDVLRRSQRLVVAAEPHLQKLTAFCYGGEGWTTEGWTAAAVCARAQTRSSDSSGCTRSGDAAAEWPAPPAGWHGRRELPRRVTRRRSDFAFVFNTRNLANMPVDDFATSLSALITSASL